MLQACIISASAHPQLTASAGPRAQPEATEVATSTQPMAGSTTRSVAEPVVQPTPT